MAKRACKICNITLDANSWPKYLRDRHRLICRECYNRWQRDRYHKKDKKAPREKRAELRKAVISAYGGKCTCCGETVLEFLNLDHINNDGAAHRKRMRTNDVYIWASKNHRPDVLQVLCMNCNFAKSNWPGGCPHQTKVTTVP